MEEEKKFTDDGVEIKEEPIVTKKAFKEKLAKKDEEIKALQEEVAKWKNEYYRVYADTQNLRNDLEKDFHRSVKYRAEGFIEKLFPVMDSFNVVLQNKPTDPTLLNYLTGFEYIYKNMMSAMESEGVSEITPKLGDKFDANTMNAIDTVEDEGEENLVKQIYCVGIKLHDRIIRHANVVVSKHPVQKEEPVNEENTSDNPEA